MTTAHATIETVEARICYGCGTKGHRVLTGLRDEWLEVPGTWNVRRCPSCELAWLDPRPLPHEIGRLYGDGYHTHSAPQVARDTFARRAAAGAVGLAAGTGPGVSEDPSLPFTERLVVRVIRALGPLRDLARGSVMWVDGPPGTLLDVGCGNGEFLVKMRERGWSVHGLEPDPAAALVAGEHHALEVTVGTVEDAVLAEGRFDVVTMSHVIEHVHDPVEVLRRCRGLLKPGGRLVAVTPNGRSLGRRRLGDRWLGWDVPRHLFVFTPETLEDYARRAGFEIDRVRTTARSVFRQVPSMLRFIELQRTGNTRDPRRLGALLLWLLEHTLLRWTPCGEEIVLHARRPG